MLTTEQVGQVPAELDRLRQLYVTRKPMAVLEIGVYFGGTLREWLQNAQPGATIVAVDPEHQNPNLYKSWSKADTTLVVVAKRSQESVEEITAHAPYDWVFIDGDHSEDGVRFDVELTRPLVRKGGLLLLHDIVAEGYPTTPPRIVLDEIGAAGTPTFQIVRDRPESYPAEHGHGIGVVYL